MNEKKDIKYKYGKYVYEMFDTIHQFGGLRVVILYELKNGPLKGIEISNRIEEQTSKIHEKRKERYYQTHKEYKNDPFTRKLKTKPSPGSLYPILKKMREEGLVVKLNDGRYENTELGNKKINEILENVKDKEEYLTKNPIESMLSDLDHDLSNLENCDEVSLSVYEDELINLTRRMKKISSKIYSLNN